MVTFGAVTSNNVLQPTRKSGAAERKRLDAKETS
jgi:hypothetical protein